MPPDKRPDPELLDLAGKLVSGRRELRVMLAMSPQQPTGLAAALVEVAMARDVRLTLLMADLDGRYDFLDRRHLAAAVAGRLRLVALAGGIPRFWHRHVDYFPAGFRDIDCGLASGLIPVDLVLAEMAGSPGDTDPGYGAMVGLTAAALRSGAQAAAVLRPETLRFADAPRVPRDRFAAVIAAPARPEPPPAATPSAIQSALAVQVARLVPDGATVQFGLGSMAEALAAALEGKAGLGVHSGTVTGALARLDLARPAVATGLVGPANGMAERIALRPVGHTHDPAVLAAQPRLWALNSCFEVDLSARVNAEYVDGCRLASGGGQSDFARAAHLSPGGASVILLPSVTGKGKSRIIAALPAGQRETTAPQDVDFVVTEQGAADLRGKTAAERRAALIAVAHPDHRAALAAAPPYTDITKESTP